MHVWYIYWTSIHICYSNNQPSVLSVALATGQRSSNGCYNCTRQEGPYHPAVMMVKGLFLWLYTTFHKYFCCKFYPSIKLTFFCILIIKNRYVLWSNNLSHIFSWYHPFSISCHALLHFLKNCFPKVGIFYENNTILCYYQIPQKVVWKVHGAWNDGYDSQNKDKKYYHYEK